MHSLRFRQVHLDFHTSPDISNVGGEFDKNKWQQTLKIARVDSITCFSKCHHGWTYHETSVGKKHPHMVGELLRKQFDACKEIDINVPVYLSAGLDEMIADVHPEWLEAGPEGPRAGDIGAFRKLCFNSPYIEYLCEQIKEAVRMFPNSDGIFLDIISQGQCYCESCKAIMHKNGWDINNEADRRKCSQLGLDRYYEMTTAAAKVDDPDMPVFHNSGHISRGYTEILKYFSHLELESLPTGGWGYDHFPVSAKYCQNLPYDFLGMTGKFHTTWGEFGGYKHPNALRYECAAMLAYGAKCSVGDQLHPEGAIDESTYDIIGAAYKEVEQKEAWCNNVKNVAEIGLLSCISLNYSAESVWTMKDDSDVGAGRILLEGHFLFDVLDGEMDFNHYKVLVLPDEVRIDAALKDKLDKYLAQGGKLFMTGSSGLWADKDEFAFDIGAEHFGASEYQPDYILPIPQLRPEFVNSPLVMYTRSRRIKAAAGKSLGDVYDPYFNRGKEKFCSHQHTPYTTKPSGYDCGVIHKNIMYLAHPVFKLYRGMGAVAYRHYITKALRMFIDKPALTVNMPSTARVSLMHQVERKRHILHLLFANTVNRGGEMELSGGTVSGKSKGVEVIEELLPLRDTKVKINTGCDVKKVMLQPQGTELEFVSKDGCLEFTVDKFTCHQMVELKY